ncbi:MAG: hypothetical protein IJ713_08000 [Oscillibacter sp.]|nr:hypothetical protein [Oscillibacter sp.]
MSGELTLERKSVWSVALALLASAAVTAAVMLLYLQHPLLPGGNLWPLFAMAALTFVIFRIMYPAAEELLFHGRAAATVAWTVTAETLAIGGRTIRRADIKNVYCWPNRDALGNSQAGWTVNIETAGKNELLRSLTRGAEIDDSVRRLRELVAALGYGSQWPEPEE